MIDVLSEIQIKSLAEYLENAELNAKEVCKITNEFPNMTFDEAYDIQWEIRKRKISRGNKIIGMKMGLTSWAKMAQMGVETPVYGFLADYFSVPDGGIVDTNTLIHPKIEPEIAFFTKNDLRGPGCHIGQVIAATDFIVPAVEVIDSRYENFNFDLISVVADNTSSARFISGGKMSRLADLDLKTLGVVVEKNGEVVAVGAGASVLGHPASSVAMLANMLSEREEYIPAGSFIMTGGITAAIAVSSGDNITVKYQGLGNISARFI